MGLFIKKTGFHSMALTNGGPWENECGQKSNGMVPPDLNTVSGFTSTCL